MAGMGSEGGLKRLGRATLRRGDARDVQRKDVWTNMQMDLQRKENSTPFSTRHRPVWGCYQKA